MKEKKKCGTEVFARVTGFFTPVERYNPGKKKEFDDRKMYTQPKEYSTMDKEYPPIERDGWK